MEEKINDTGWSFCITPEENCKSKYCNEHGCLNQKTENHSRTIDIDFRELLKHAKLSYEDLENECTVNGQLDAEKLLTIILDQSFAKETLEETFSELKNKADAK